MMNLQPAFRYGLTEHHCRKGTTIFKSCKKKPEKFAYFPVLFILMYILCEFYA